MAAKTKRKPKQHKAHRNGKPAPQEESPPLRLEWREADSLTDNPGNWRTHPANQAAALKDVLAEVGWAGALLLNERTGQLIDGHLRKKVAAGQRVPVLVGNWSVRFACRGLVRWALSRNLPPNRFAS